MIKTQIVYQKNIEMGKNWKNPHSFTKKIKVKMEKIHIFVHKDDMNIGKIHHVSQKKQSHLQT